MNTPITFILNPSEITAGTRGASLGPDAIRTVARSRKDYLFSRYPLLKIPDVNDLLDRETRFKNALRIDGLVQIYESLNKTVGDTLKEGRFPLVLAGDHGSAGGTIAGIRTANPDKRLGVIWIDAHGDLHTPHTTPSGNVHGMPLATALNEDNLPCRRNDILGETAELWNKLKNCGGIAPKVLPSDLAFVGVRDTEPEEDALIERLNIRNFTVEEVNSGGTAAITEQLLDKLSDCDLIYISFDVDSMDPALTSHGTGTPVDNGLTPRQAEELLCGLAANEKVCCIEFVEVNPCLDEKTNKMAETAYELLKSVVSTLESRK